MKEKSNTCPRCGGEFRDGKALKNTANYGTPDFPGQTDLAGQTFDYSGPAQMLDVDKCSACGYSRTK